MPNSEESRQRSHKATTQQAPIKAWTGHPYPAYKDSGVEWLGKVPEHWEVRHLGAFGRFLKGSGGTKADETKEGVPCIRYGDLYTRHQFHITESKTCIAPHRVAAYTPISYGDVLFAGSGETLEEIGKSAVNLIRGPAVCGGDVIIFRPTLELDAEFIGWSADCRQAASQKAQMGRGITVMHIYSNDLKYLTIPLPPLSEQRAIAHFLDDANKRIQRYIHAKEKLIKLLEEQKRVIIHQAVTGQIDVRTGKAYPAYKDSGVEWLGEVPEHWDLVRLKHIARVQTGLTLGKNYKKIQTISRPYLRVANVQTGCLDLTKVKSIDVPPDEANRATLLNGDVLMTEGGDIDKLGRGCVWRDEIPNCLHQNHIFAVRCRQNILIPEFLVRLMASQYGRIYFQITAKQTTNLASTNSNILGAFPIPLPPIKDQLSICHLIYKETSTLANLVRQTEHQITLLHEYRTRLIADVVTGKLDVREAAAALPEKDPPTGGDNCQDGMAFAPQVQSRCP